MNRATAWTVHASTILVGGTGLVYAWMSYLATPADEFSIVGHPWQPQVQHLHIWTAPLLVFGVGLIWRDHAWRHYRRGQPHGRRSGISLLLSAAPMVASGYFIQTAAEHGWRRAWVVVHLAASALFAVGYVVHQIVDRRRRRSRPTRV